MADNLPARDLARQFVSFTFVGLLGLAVDAGFFLLMTGAYLWPVTLARTLSASGSIATTWVLNRTPARSPSTALRAAESNSRATRSYR